MSSAPLPAVTRWVIIGAGFAGAATAWALGRAGLGPGVIVEQESSWGVHASGRNAGMARLCEQDPLIAALVGRSLARMRGLQCRSMPLIRPIGGWTLAGRHGAASLEAQHDSLRRQGVDAQWLSSSEARARNPFLSAVNFEGAVWSGDDGVVDIHALLGRYLIQARAAGFILHTACRAEELIVEGGRVKGIHTSSGDVRAEGVVDAGGAWAGRLGQSRGPLPLQPLQRHLFVSTPTDRVPSNAPLVWVEDAAFYFRPDSGGLLLSPCDETPVSPGAPSIDPAAAELLAEKIARHAPGLAELSIRRAWACLRTFAPDRRPLIGPDPWLSGFFHVSGLGGVGMTCSAAIGELARDLLTDRRPDWIDPSTVVPARFMSVRTEMAEESVTSVCSSTVKEVERHPHDNASRIRSI